MSDEDASRKIVELVQDKRPDLMLLTDDVYGTFVDRVPLAARRDCRRTPSASTPTRSISAAPAGGSASSRSTRTTSSTR